MTTPPTHINLILTSTTVGEHWREDYYKSGADPVAYVRDEWMDIESAPCDGTWVLGVFNGMVMQMSWGRYGAYCDHWMALGRMTSIGPTHWRPLPTPPMPSNANK